MSNPNFINPKLPNGINNPDVSFNDVIQNTNIHKNSVYNNVPTGQDIIEYATPELRSIVNEQMIEERQQNIIDSYDTNISEKPPILIYPPIIGNVTQTPQERYDTYPITSTLQFYDYNLPSYIRHALNFWNIDERTPPQILQNYRTYYLNNGYISELSESQYNIAYNYLLSLR